MTINSKKRRPYLSIVLLYLAFNLLFLTGSKWLIKFNTATDVLIIGNSILFVATLLSFFLYSRALKNNKPHQFLKYIYGGMFLKMLICLIAAFIYIASFGKNVNKPAIFGCMFLYFLYTFVEVSILLRMSKEQKNGQTRSPS
jgi:FtsH-binding integral membrane protein